MEPGPALATIKGATEVAEAAAQAEAAAEAAAPAVAEMTLLLTMMTNQKCNPRCVGFEMAAEAEAVAPLCSTHGRLMLLTN